MLNKQGSSLSQNSTCSGQFNKTNSLHIVKVSTEVKAALIGGVKKMRAMVIRQSEEIKRPKNTAKTSGL